MNALDRLTRATALTLCAALVNTALPLEALAHVVTRVPVGNAPIGGPVMVSGVASVAGASTLNSLVPAASLRLAPNSAPTPALALTPSAPASAVSAAAVSVQPGFTAATPAQAAAAADAPVRAAAPAAAALMPVASPVAELAAAADAQVTGEFKADNRASAVADTSRIATAFAALKRSFGLRSAEKLGAPSGAAAVVASRAPPAAALTAAKLAPAGGLISANDGADVPPAPPSTPTDPADEAPKKGGFGGLSKAALAFIGALLVAQIGVEAMGNAMPVLAQQVFGDFTVVAQLAIFSSIASILGRQFGPLIIERFGLRNTYLFTEIARMVSISSLLGLLVMGHMTIPLMMAFYSLNGLLGGVALTAETSIPPALVGQDQGKLEKFWTWEQTLLEIIGVLGPILAGIAVDAYGPGPTLMAFPAAFAAAFMILFFTLRIPQRVEQLRLADVAKKQAALEAKRAAGEKPDSVLGGFFKKIARGAKLVWSTPILRYAFLAYSAYMLLNPFLYGMIGPAFARMIAGPEAMGGVFGLVAGLYSAGGLLGGLVMIREQSKLKKAKDSGAVTDEQETELLRKSMLKWMMWTIPTLAAFATMAFMLPTLGAFVALPAWLAWAGPLTIPALALIPFGVAQVISMVKIRSYFQAKVPTPTDMADAMGFLGSASLAASTVGILALKFLFQNTSGTMPFVIIAAAMVPLAIFYFYITRKLGKVGAPVTPAS